MATQHGQRLVFDNARALVQNAGFSVGQAVLSQSYLRSEVLMSTSSTSYNIPILVNSNQNGANSSFPTSNLLALQDAFVVSQVGIYIANPATATATAFKLYSYNNAVEFSTAGAADALLNLYNGYMSIVVNQRTIVPSWGLYKHYEVPQTQEDTQGGGNSGFDQFSSDTATFPMEPNVVFVGSKNNQVTLNLPGAISTLQAGSAPKIVVIFSGILAQNVTPVR
jgi:hypothetical protein